ncbi:MAG: TlpA family protein disulfide reductase [Chloroflexota bacterium]
MEDTITELGITYPVAVDSDRDTWEAYGMQFYPSWAVIAPDGELSDRQAGAVSAGAEEAIQEALDS